MNRLLFLLILILLSFATDNSAASDSAPQTLECSDDCDVLLKQLKRYARNGSPHAQTLLALSYRSGELIDITDPDKAWKWMKRARNQRYAPAQYYISQWYRLGYNTEPDLERADEYLERAAKQDFAPAVYDLGILYVKANNDEGISLIEKAASLGSPEARQLIEASIMKEAAIAEASKVQSTDTAIEESTVIVDSRPTLNPDDEVITILGSKQEPLALFVNILDDIYKQKLYNNSNRRGTGSRLGDLKCGQPGSACKRAGSIRLPDGRVIYVDP